MSLEEGCEAGRCYLRWDEFPPDHGKAAALYRLHHIFGFVQLGWLRVDLHSQVRTDKTGLIDADSPHWKTKCWCRTCRAQEGRWSHAWQTLGSIKQIVGNKKDGFRTILSSQMAEHKCKSYKIMKWFLHESIHRCNQKSSKQRRWYLSQLFKVHGFEESRSGGLARGRGANDVEAKGTKGGILSQKSRLTCACWRWNMHQSVMQQRQFFVDA